MDSWDGIESFLITESMVLKHTAKLDPTVPGVEKLNFDVRYTVFANKAIRQEHTITKALCHLSQCIQ